MAVFGLLTQKSSLINPEFDNRYWLNTPDIDDVNVYAGTIIDIEQKAFGQLVTWVNTHAWKPNVFPNSFRNQPRNEPGNINTSLPIKSEICLELVFGTADSYLNYKRYRVQVESNYLAGTRWHADMLDIAAEMCTDFTSLLNVLCTKSGTPYTGVTFNSEYVFQQVGKAWYNRDA